MLSLSKYIQPAYFITAGIGMSSYLLLHAEHLKYTPLLTLAKSLILFVAVVFVYTIGTFPVLKKRPNLVITFLILGVLGLFTSSYWQWINKYEMLMYAGEVILVGLYYFFFRTHPFYKWIIVTIVWTLTLSIKNPITQEILWIPENYTLLVLIAWLSFWSDLKDINDNGKYNFGKFYLTKNAFYIFSVLLFLCAALGFYFTFQFVGLLFAIVLGGYMTYILLTVKIRDAFTLAVYVDGVLLGYAMIIYTINT